jgi:ribosomal protein S20
MRRGLLGLLAATAVTFASSAAAQTPAPATSGATPPLQMRTALSHSGYTGSTRLLLKLDYFCSAAADAERPPLNIALVLDASTSMAEGQKTQSALEAARRLIDNLSPRDVISLVAFNDTVTVLSPAGRSVNKAFLFHRLGEIAPRGYTDLSAGLLEGIAQVRAQSMEGQVRQVLLLTDGRATRGVTKTDAIRNLAAKAHAGGISISIVGCGPEVNEATLKALAEAGGGRYTYIKSPEEIPLAFEQVGGGREVLAQNVRLDVAVAGAHIAKVNGQPASGPRAAERFVIGNMRATDRGLFLLELKPSKFEPGSAVKTNVRLTFDNPQTGQRATFDAAGSIGPVAQTELREDAGLVLYGEMLDALTLAEEAATGMDAPRATLAQANFAATYAKAHQYAIAQHDQELLNQTFLLKHFVEEIGAAAQRGLLHDHRAERAKFQKEADYRRYLLNHHRLRARAHPAVRD